ncbi:fungal specific transcription factor domain protein [Penicillium brasilianum]|uniref:Fungal specific transcription factor domain protein n=1 Tax=Penicillium brasilianum TaxID=104259 RepID=A0A1S9RQD9_PENBI|nr:fungal specific transcription factor domain protein [Penicillium brasilianum]
MSIPFPSWNEQQNLFLLSSVDAETCNQLSLDNPLPALQRPESDAGIKKMAIPRLAEGADSAFTSPGRFHRRHDVAIAGRRASFAAILTVKERSQNGQQLASLSAKVQAYEDVIRKLSDRFGVSDEQLVNIALVAESAPELTLNADASLISTGERSRRSDSEPPPDRASSPSALDCADHTEEDFNRDETARATGFIGRSSEIAWLQKLSNEVNNECEEWSSNKSNDDDDNGLPSPTLTPLPEKPSDPLVASSNYYIDDLEAPKKDQVNVFGVPSRDAATKLLNAYLISVHPSFPIIGISTFISQFQVFFSQPSLKPGSKWLAILNLIFAIASKYGQLTDAEWKEGDDDHQMYFSRARSLCLEGQLLHHPDLQQLQVEGLACFYLMASGHINRAWKLSGSAIRGALGLGLHLQNVGVCTSDISKEIRYRVWWSLYNIEHLLGVMTGRPSCIIDSSCTTPLPVPFDESEFQKEEVAQLISVAGRGTSSPLDRMSFGSSAATLDSTADSDTNDTPAESDTKRSRSECLKSLPPCMSLYFLQMTSLTTIAKRMTTKLYSPEALQSPWASIEFTIQSLMLGIDSWFMNLPSAYDFTSTQTSQCLVGQRMGLAFLFYSTKIGITRPCLCRIESSPPEDDKTHEFCCKTAAECVESACHMLTLFPDTPDAAMLHRNSPWWCTLHYLMQATTVLLLELAFHSQHVPEKANMVLKAVKKAIDWLAALSKTNMASERAWKLCDGFLRRLAPHIGIDVNELSDNEESSSNSLFEVSDVIGSTEAGNNQFIDDLAFDQPSALTAAPMATADSIAAEMDSIACSPIKPPVSPLGISVPYNIETVDLSETLAKSENSLPGQLPYDELFPYDPTTGQITGSFFPSGPNMDLDMGYFWGDAVC